jgi:hypothetical protein
MAMCLIASFGSPGIQLERIKVSMKAHVIVLMSCALLKSPIFRNLSRRSICIDSGIS